MKTVTQIASDLNVDKQTVYTWIREGKLNVTRLGAGPKARVRITQEQLNEFMST